VDKPADEEEHGHHHGHAQLGTHGKGPIPRLPG